MENNLSFLSSKEYTTCITLQNWIYASLFLPKSFLDWFMYILFDVAYHGNRSK